MTKTYGRVRFGRLDGGALRFALGSSGSLPSLRRHTDTYDTCIIQRNRTAA